MQILSLEHTSPSTIARCFNDAFADYYVKFNANETYFINRWKAARVSYALSYGAFEEERLVGFMLMGIDQWEGLPTAYNAGTGVIPEERGRRLVEKMYSRALPALQAQGIQQSTLEVITINEKAIKAYKNVGYEIARELHCFSGEIKQTSTDRLYKSKHIPFDTLPTPRFPYSWENNLQGIKIAPHHYEYWYIKDDNQIIASAIINPGNGYIAQYFFTDPDQGLQLLAAIGQHCPVLKINNIDSRDDITLSTFTLAGLNDFIQQYEMKLLL
ncbi:ribosomal protein S18 acetylase RimI-like enzyme [Chitinophaga skermanii]|uniref:Ribosomal protein S18 acetylase RimI-like enzyme n=1 Tax=Chitinophaga skermanii TaxID=331697 RepID=A0A327Q095_9BACT|nr:GNAT family N-acetyltransferase [Chitinophaga skermanii]RAI97875.1 ribosomal protein S18 acetylase RimI-like enzyme [Chitinophaga skermanii]